MVLIGPKSESAEPLGFGNSSSWARKIARKYNYNVLVGYLEKVGEQRHTSVIVVDKEGM